MKVCMFSLNECNSNFNTVRRLTRTLAAAGHDVRVIAYLTGRVDRYEESDGARIFRVTLYPVDPEMLRPVLLLAMLPYKSALRVCGFIVALLSRLVRKLPGLRPAKSPPVISGAKEGGETGRGGAPASARVVIYNPLSGVYRLFSRLERRIYWRCYRMARYLLLLLPYIYLAYLFYYWRSFRLARKEPADVYHANDLVTMPVAWLCSRLTGGKLVYDSHELWLDRPRLRKRSRLNRFIVHRIESFFIHHTDANIIAGESSSKALSERYNIGPPIVIMNVPYYHPFERSTVFRDKLGISAEERIILYMGKISWGRGIESGIQSLKHLSQVSCVVFGSGLDSYVAELKVFIEDKGLADRVYFFGEVPFDEVTRHAMSADIGLVLHQNIGLNYYYVSPNKLFECMAAGLPVVGSNFPDLKKYIEGYNLGVTCDPESPKDIAEAIDYILSDETRYNEMRKNALEAAKVFNWENESKKLVALYDGLGQKSNV